MSARTLASVTISLCYSVAKTDDGWIHNHTGRTVHLHWARGEDVSLRAGSDTTNTREATIEPRALLLLAPILAAIEQADAEREREAAEREAQR